MSLPMKRGLPPTPPDKGSFPLDHFGTCVPLQQRYLTCVAGQTQNRSSNCKPFMRLYLECRMQHGLMAVEDLSWMGSVEDIEKEGHTGTTAAPNPKPASSTSGQKK